MPPVRCIALILVTAAAAHAEPKVLLFPALGTPQRVTVSGRALEHAPTKGSSTLSTNLRRLAASNLEDAKVEVRAFGQSVTTKTDGDGNFTASFVPKKAAPGFTTAEAKVKGSEVATATVTIVSPDAPFFVVSDFDDTIAVSKVTSKRGLLKTALLADGETQPPVEGMAAFYRCLEQDKKARPGFALVSGSPLQFSGRIGTFLTKNGFPVFGLYLRDLGPSTLSDYKQPIIRSLLEALPNKVVLVGDSGEHDPEVYAQLRKENPDRVLAVYIRNAGRAEDAARFDGMMLFDKPEDAARDAVKRGLASASCVDAAFPPEKK